MEHSLDLDAMRAFGDWKRIYAEDLVEVMIYQEEVNLTLEELSVIADDDLYDRVEMMGYDWSESDLTWWANHTR